LLDSTFSCLMGYNHLIRTGDLVSETGNLMLTLHISIEILSAAKDDITEIMMKCSAEDDMADVDR
jgi:hypothetical protein